MKDEGSDIESDPLYQALFAWGQKYCGRPVLIDEAKSPQDACWCMSRDREVERAWLYHADRMHALSENDYNMLRDVYDAAQERPFFLFSFFISPDRKVTVGHFLFSQAGMGGDWKVVEGADGVDFEPHSGGGFWIS